MFYAMLSIRTVVLILVTAAACGFVKLMIDGYNASTDDCGKVRSTVDKLYTINLDGNFRDHVVAQIVYSTDTCFTRGATAWAEKILGGPEAP
jgi:hypothetical protein